MTVFYDRMANPDRQRTNQNARIYPGGTLGISGWTCAAGTLRPWKP